MARGVLTDEVKKVSEELFGYEFNKTQLRLLPYMMYTLMDCENLKREHINQEDKVELEKWEDAKEIYSPMEHFMISSSFYDAMCKILKIAYCGDALIKE